MMAEFVEMSSIQMRRENTAYSKEMHPGMVAMTLSFVFSTHFLCSPFVEKCNMCAYAAF